MAKKFTSASLSAALQGQSKTRSARAFKRSLGRSMFAALPANRSTTGVGEAEGRRRQAAALSRKMGRRR